MNAPAPPLRHLITLDGMDRVVLTRLLDSAVQLREQFRNERWLAPLLAERTIVNLFFEPSTRTRTSFELAARRLGAHVINFDIAQSSTAMPWYAGPTLLELLETVEIVADLNPRDFRFPVQYVNRPHLDFRGFCGTIAAGAVRPGDEVVALPSGRRSRPFRLRAIST